MGNLFCVCAFLKVGLVVYNFEMGASRRLVCDALEELSVNGFVASEIALCRGASYEVISTCLDPAIF